jgi:two-component system, OmpR family, alkaline phosphatase synthesis response regulator PhoP
MIRILFIEDEAAFAVGVVDRLRAEGYYVVWEKTGAAGYQTASATVFDLILLDVMLPGKSGFDICRDLRRQGITGPVLMLTARGELIDRVLGLKLGADDFVQKNCEPIELMARIEALIRRSRPSSHSAETASFGDVSIDQPVGELGVLVATEVGCRRRIGVV